MHIDKKWLFFDESEIAIGNAVQGKIIDLGINGDLDWKARWNKIFIVAKNNLGTASSLTVVMKTGDRIDRTTLKIGGQPRKNATQGADGSVTVTSGVVPLADAPIKTLVEEMSVPAGGSVTVGVPIPAGVRRYVTLSASVYDAACILSAGITDEVDTDIDPGVDRSFEGVDTSVSAVKSDADKVAALMRGEEL